MTDIVGQLRDTRYPGQLGMRTQAADEIEQLRLEHKHACQEVAVAVAERDRLRAALEEIRDHWANQYDHPRKENEMYRGPYGIGITDGHRACRIIAEKALSPFPPSERGSQ